MTYATQQNMIDRFGEDELVQLTDRVAPATGAIVAAVMDKALTDADAEINSYLQARYAVPLSPAPAMLERVACDIARYQLYDDRATEQVIQRYKDAVKWLRDVSTGVVNLGIDAAGGATDAQDLPEMASGESVFRRDRARDFV